MRKLIAVDGANIRCPMAINGSESEVIGTCSVNDTACGSSTLTLSDRVVGENIIPFKSKCRLRRRWSSPWPEFEMCEPIMTYWRKVAVSKFDGGEVVLTEDSYFKCGRSGQPEVHISNPGQYSVYIEGGIMRTTDASFYYISASGEIQFAEGTGKVHMYYVEQPNGDFKLVQTLVENAAGLVKIPDSGDGFGRYGTEDAGGTSGGEIVGAGDRFLNPTTAAALFGLINEAHEQGITILLGDMSSENGSDPWQAGFPHHAGHGHFGNRTGLDIDFEYIGNNGTSYNGFNTAANFNPAYNATIFQLAYKYGFTENYFTGDQQTLLGGSIPGLSNISGHADHGHLGFDPNHVQPVS